MKRFKKIVFPLLVMVLFFSCTNDKLKEQDAMYKEVIQPDFYGSDETSDDTTIPSDDPDDGTTDDTGDGDGDGTDPDNKE
ncbi:hypothetical protein MQE36_14525 [Zhouia spongiae]|uniref:Lipoprotein n=1 Tax=Zhouia spongiae TaxID=2202721 RepID=A0ABY3YKC6_9FLAO|nr:hypothetical protein [Zhouia spongiae]UNY98294.1 hypothetical protein MQE36_14525 [Zhouia spongiae]